jgi:hypothetical protein
MRSVGFAPGGGSGLSAQLVVRPGQGAVIAPGGEIAVDGPPGREVRGTYRQARPVRSRYEIASMILWAGQTRRRPRRPRRCAGWCEGNGA